MYPCKTSASCNLTPAASRNRPARKARNSRMPVRLTGGLFLVWTFLLPSVVSAQKNPGLGDWPCWRGPERTGVSAETGLLGQWPKDGPRLVWKAGALGGGYSTPSVAGGRVFLMGSEGAEEFLRAVDARTGRILWSTKVGAVGKNEGPNYPGPRCTPTVGSDAVYALGSDGDLVCADPVSGKIRWHKHLEKDFDGNRGIWAYTESPLLDGEVLVSTPGGPTATLVALNRRDGAVLWKAALPEGNQAGYASAIVAEAAGIKQYVQFLGAGLVGVSAADGKVLWQYQRHVGGQSCGTPVFHEGCVFSSASGMGGSGGDVLLRLTAEGGAVKAEEVYFVRAMTNHHGGVVRVGDYLYGTGAGALVCMEFKTGAVKWKERGVGKGSLMAADGHLYVRGERGAVALVEATPTGYREKGRFQQPDRSAFPTFCHPVVAGGRLYLRDADVLLCYEVKEPGAGR